MFNAKNVVALLIVATTTACFRQSIEPRTATLARPGEKALRGSITLYARAPGEVTVDDGSVHKGNLGRNDPIETITGVFGPLGSSTATLELGLHERFALSTSLGIQRTSVELRTSLLDERRGAPLSLALAAGPRIGIATLLQDKLGAGAQGGVDVSREVAGLIPFANLYVTWAAEYYGRNVGDIEGRDCYYDCQVHFARRETRLVLGAGITGFGELGLAIVPYWVLRAHAPRQKKNRTVDAVDVDNHWGVSFMLTSRFGS